MNDRSTARPFNFEVTFDRIKSTVFYCQEVTIPTMNISQVRISQGAFDVPIPGDKMTYDDSWSITVILDENNEAYQVVHDWMWAIRSPMGLTEHKIVKDCLSDAVVTLKGNNQQVIGRYHFVDCFPISLPGPVHKTTSSEDEQMTIQISFSFTRFKYERVGYPTLPV